MSQLFRTAQAALAGLIGSAARRMSRAHEPGWIKAENELPGTRSWRMGADGTQPADDVDRQIQGYTSATSVNVGESMDFHVTVSSDEDYTVGIYRIGYYGGGGGGRHVTTSPALPGVKQPAPDLDPVTGLVSCAWPVTWTLAVGPDWTSGLYMAVFTTASGRRSMTPFVVRDDRRPARLLVVVPFFTYQAYNMWPLDGRRGKSLYYGYDPDLSAGGASADSRKSAAHRAHKVSFDRPYGTPGIPGQCYYDLDFVGWLEQAGYDATYCASEDLHTGRVDLSKFVAVIFSGHDEYWTGEMRNAAERAVAHGTSLAFMSANTAYWHIRLEPSADGRDNRVVVCYKGDADPEPGIGGATTKWRTRSPGPGRAEQGLLGIQYRSVVPSPVPLVVASADHWLWADCGVSDGDAIDNLVAGEADNRDPRYPVPTGATQTLVAASPYVMQDGTEAIHNASVCETSDGALVFVAGTFHWVLGLTREGFQDKRIQMATANLVNRMLRLRA